MVSPAVRTLIAALALLPFIGACVPEQVVAPSAPPTLNEVLADAADPSVEWVSGWFSGAGVIVPAIDPARCSFDAASQYFVCTPLTNRGLTLEQRFTLIDAGGGNQSAFDPAKTVTLHLENSVNGTWSSSSYAPGDTLVVQGQQVLDLTGIGTARHTLNGTSLTLLTMRSPRTPGPQIPDERRTTITDLVLPVVVAPKPDWPLSGTVDTRSASIDADGNPYNVFIASMRFDGTGVVTLTMTVPGGILTCPAYIPTSAYGLGCEGGSSSIPVGVDALPRMAPAVR